MLDFPFEGTFLVVTAEVVAVETGPRRDPCRGDGACQGEPWLWRLDQVARCAMRRSGSSWQPRRSLVRYWCRAFLAAFFLGKPPRRTVCRWWSGEEWLSTA